MSDRNHRYIIHEKPPPISRRVWIHLSSWTVVLSSGGLLLVRLDADERFIGPASCMFEKNPKPEFVDVDAVAKILDLVGVQSSCSGSIENDTIGSRRVDAGKIALGFVAGNKSKSSLLLENALFRVLVVGPSVQESLHPFVSTDIFFVADGSKITEIQNALPVYLFVSWKSFRHLKRSERTLRAGFWLDSADGYRLCQQTVTKV